MGRFPVAWFLSSCYADPLYTFTHPWSDGTTGIQLSPLELLEKLVALVSLPHVHMVRCPFCQHGALRIIATITQGEVISKVLRHLKLAADPPPIAPARSR